MMAFAILKRAMGFSSSVVECEPTVGVGDRFYEHGRWDMVWVVERLLEPQGTAVPHAVISHSRVPTEKRLIALSTLCDPGRFERDQRAAAPTLPPAASRRRRHDAPRDHPSAAEFGVA